jgi:sec-independent protein translocase protein TatA
MFEITPLQLGGIPGGPELLIILVLAVLLFGASKIPKLARSSGQAIGEFQKGREQVEQELDEMRDATNLEDEDEDDGGLIDTEPVTSDSGSSSGGDTGGGGGE